MLSWLGCGSSCCPMPIFSGLLTGFCTLPVSCLPPLPGAPRSAPRFALISADSGLAEGVERILVVAPGSPRVVEPCEGVLSAYVRIWKAAGASDMMVYMSRVHNICTVGCSVCRNRSDHHLAGCHATARRGNHVRFQSQDSWQLK